MPGLPTKILEEGFLGVPRKGHAEMSLLYNKPNWLFLGRIYLSKIIRIALGKEGATSLESLILAVLCRPALMVGMLLQNWILNSNVANVVPE